MKLQLAISLNVNDTDVDLQSWTMRYMEARLTDASLYTMCHWENFLKKLKRFLGCPGTTADLNRKTLSAFLRFIARRNGGCASANQAGEKFIALWRWLHEQHAVALPPPSPIPRVTPDGIVVFPKAKPALRYERRWTALPAERPDSIAAVNTAREALLYFYTPGDYAQITIDDMARAVDRWEEFGTGKPVKEIAEADLKTMAEGMKAVGFAEKQTTKTVAYFSRLVLRAKRIAAKRGAPVGSRVLNPMPEPEEPDGTLWSYFHLLYCPHRLRGSSENTIRNYTVQFRHFKRCLCRDPVLTDLTEETIGNVMDYLKDMGRAARTANKFADQMLSVWGYLARKRVVERFPDPVERFPEAEAAPLAWNREQLKTLWDAIGRLDGGIDNRVQYETDVPASVFWRALISTIWNTGERIGAVMKLEWSDVVFDDKGGAFVTMRAQNRKGRRKPKKSKLHPITVALLKKMRKCDPNGERVFAWRRPYVDIWKAYDEILMSAGLPHGRDSKFHRMRKSAATWFEVAGGDATKLLGHSSRRVTERYIDETICVPKQAADVLFSLDELS